MRRRRAVRVRPAAGAAVSRSRSRARGGNAATKRNGKPPLRLAEKPPPWRAEVGARTVVENVRQEGEGKPEVGREAAG